MFKLQRKFSATNHKFEQFLAILLGLVLLVATMWLTLFSQPPALDPALTAAQHGNHAMYHAVKFTVTDSAGQPAPYAVITIADQQLVADQDGVVYFGHLFHTWYESTVYYNNQHYRQNIAVYGTNLQLKLDGISFEMRRFGASACGAALVILAGWLLFITLSNARQSRLSGRRKRVAGAVAFVAGLIVATVCLVLPVLLNPVVAQAANETVLDSLPVPANVLIEEDDNNAIVSWNGGTSPDANDPAGISGYKVSWGVTGQPLANILYTHYRITQLQPLVNGQPYSVQVQAIDMRGNLSKPSAAYSFTGNPARVNDLRKKMNGFFDDFNLPAGNVDERKWNESYSYCNNPNLSAFFINNQYHSHNLISDANCDRGQSISRPRQMFDFTNRTGTITFDFDGSFTRDIWYLDIIPQLTDVTGHVHLDNPTIPDGPANMLRLRQNEQDVSIIWINAKGEGETLADTTNSQTSLNLQLNGVQLVPNVRRHWTVKLSQNQVEMLVNGKSVLSAQVNLPFSKAWLLWTQFSYNNNKAHQPYNLIHWDNFGFDAPANASPPVVTHNYRTAKPGGGDYMDVSQDAPATATINIPDSVAGAKASRLFFSQQSEEYEWTPQDQVIVNGKAFKVAKPESGSLAVDDLVSVLVPYTSVVELPVGTLQQGNNQIEFQLTKSGVLNIHVELDFAANSAPKFTPSYVINPDRAAIPTMPDVGPGAHISAINKVDSETADDKLVVPVAGVVDVRVVAANDIALRATGKNPGITRIELMLGQLVVYKEEISPVPYYETVIRFDTTKYANGKHQLFVRAYNPYNTPSLSDYFGEDNIQNGSLYPIYVQINNSKSGAIAVPVLEFTPTPGADTEASQPTPAATGVASVETTPEAVATNAPALPGAVQTTPVAKNDTSPLLLTIGGVLLGLYMLFGLSIWYRVRRQFRAINPTKQPLAFISLDYMLLWPFFIGRKRKQPPPNNNL